MKGTSQKTFLIAGVGLLLLGFVLMLWTGGLIKTSRSLWPLIPVVIGLMSLYRGFVGGGRAGFVLVGMVLAQVGIVVFIANTVMAPIGLNRLWPLFMTVTGISLFVYAFKKGDRNTRVTLIIPSVALIILSFFFLLFSLELVTTGFQEFVGRWWPGLFVIAGAGLVIAWAIRTTTGKGDDNQPKGGEEIQDDQ